MLVTQQFSIKLDGYYPILNDMHLSFGPGVHIIMGPNGVGKSTFAHALMGSPTLETSGNNFVLCFVLATVGIMSMFLAIKSQQYNDKEDK